MAEDDRVPDDERMLFLLWCKHHFKEHEEVLGPHTVTNHLHLLEAKTTEPAPA